MNGLIEQIRRRAMAAGAAKEGERVGGKSVEAKDVEIIRDERDGPNGDFFQFSAIANTASVDLDDEVVVPEGAVTDYFYKFRSIYLNHDIACPVGHLDATKLIDGLGWQIKVSLKSETQVARDTRTLVREGLIRGVSIGFVALDYSAPTRKEIERYGPHSNIVRKWRWLETSVTPMPCNPDALIQARSKGLIAPETAIVLGLDERADKTVVLG